MTLSTQLLHHHPPLWWPSVSPCVRITDTGSTRNWKRDGTKKHLLPLLPIAFKPRGRRPFRGGHRLEKVQVTLLRPNITSVVKMTRTMTFGTGSVAFAEPLRRRHLALCSPFLPHYKPTNQQTINRFAMKICKINTTPQKIDFIPRVIVKDQSVRAKVLVPAAPSGPRGEIDRRYSSLTPPWLMTF